MDGVKGMAAAPRDATLEVQLNEVRELDVGS